MVVQTGEIDDRTQIPCLLGHQEETAEETLGFWFVDRLDCPFGQERVYCRLQDLGRIPGAEGQRSPGQ